ncbi:MAG: hypothetical protein EVG15_08815 [Candidatus Acididesulfobacter diazotrophicus]|jgi:hypothetical protein|uniref:Uncharacterized protein n=1 Tax=Candidatus Acididesulfobacter diazotrophicus TaxID=2597226 RepID=A0A519BKV7_9DELT|nr:MAG: hypothetical protein EVG15_08815 [Candidatus Acididesulfobacter diazotrophicus]
MENFPKSRSGLTDKKPSLDFNSAVKDLLAGKKLTGDDGILTSLQNFNLFISCSALSEYMIF